MRLVADENPRAEDEDAIRVRLRAYNLDRTQFAGPSGSFAVLIRDDGDETIGGVWTRFGYGWMFVSLLFVPESLRGTGLGRDLMQRVETHARDRKLHGIYLDTFTHQAPGFYKKLGFEEFGALENFPDASYRHFFAKRL